MDARVLHRCAAWLTLAGLLAAPVAAIRLTNATVDLDAAPATVTLLAFNDDFGALKGSVFQMLEAGPAPLVIVSWTTEMVTAELADSTQGDYVIGVAPVGQSLAFITVTVPDPDLPAIKAKICEICIDLGLALPKFCPAGCAGGYRYEDQGDGTILDCNTNLIWLKDANCFGSLIFDAAVSAAATLNDGDCGLSDASLEGDWRLPTINELCSRGAVVGTCPPDFASDSLVDSSVGPPTVVNTRGDGVWVEGDPFVGVVSGNYWSSTDLNPSDPTAAWFVNLGSGFVSFALKTGIMRPWPVRKDG